MSPVERELVELALAGLSGGAQIEDIRKTLRAALTEDENVWWAGDPTKLHIVDGENARAKT